MKLMLTYGCEPWTITSGNTGRRPKTFENNVWQHRWIDEKVQSRSKGRDENGVASQRFFKWSIYATHIGRVMRGHGEDTG